MGQKRFLILGAVGGSKATFNPSVREFFMSESTIDDRINDALYPACTDVLHGQLLYIRVTGLASYLNSWDT